MNNQHDLDTVHSSSISSASDATMNDAIQDDLIDETGFELGMPTHAEMLRHYNSLLEAELTTCQRDLLKAHKDIAGLIVMYRECSMELAALKATVSKQETSSSTPTLGYAYGDYSQRDTKR